MTTSTERMQRMRDRRKQAGLCPRCGLVDPHACPKLKANVFLRAKWRHERRCSSNGCPLPEGYSFKVCERHRENARRCLPPGGSHDRP